MDATPAPAADELRALLREVLRAYHEDGGAPTADEMMREALHAYHGGAEAPTSDQRLREALHSYHAGGATPATDELLTNARKLLGEVRRMFYEGDTAAIVASRIALEASLIIDAAVAGHLLTMRELGAVYADTIEAYRPILAGFLNGVLEGLPTCSQRRTAVAAALPRLAAALPDPRCAPAVAHAWNIAPFPIGANCEDARGGVWLSAKDGVLSRA